MKVIIAGSRNINDVNLINRYLDKLVERYRDRGISFLSGMAKGPDTIAFEYGYEHGVKVHKYPADWDKYGRSAGYIRNEEMAKNADCLLVFWDGKSKGTKHMIDLAEKYKLKIKIVMVKP